MENAWLYIPKQVHMVFCCFCLNMDTFAQNIFKESFYYMVRVSFRTKFHFTPLITILRIHSSSVYNFTFWCGLNKSYSSIWHTYRIYSACFIMKTNSKYVEKYGRTEISFVLVPAWPQWRLLDVPASSVNKIKMNSTRDNPYLRLQ